VAATHIASPAGASISILFYGNRETKFPKSCPQAYPLFQTNKSFGEATARGSTVRRGDYWRRASISAGFEAWPTLPPARDATRDVRLALTKSAGVKPLLIVQNRLRCGLAQFLCAHFLQTCGECFDLFLLARCIRFQFLHLAMLFEELVE
jgi:hypothetical protein